MTYALLVPVKGRTVPDPARHDVIPDDGRVVQLSHYWHRRIADGDVLKKPVPKASPKKSQPKLTGSKEP